MFATGGAAHLARLHDTLHATLHERVFLLRHEDIDDVARYTIRYKRDDIVDTRQGLAFCGNAGDENISKDRRFHPLIGA